MLVGVAASPVDLLRGKPRTPLAGGKRTRLVLVCEEQVDKQIDGWSGVTERLVNEA
jgi:hypothetical protein